MEPQESKPTVQPTSMLPQNSDYPGKTLGVVGLVLAFLAPIIGLVISIIASRKSKNAGHPNAIAKLGIILGVVFTVLSAIVVTILIFVFAGLFAKCSELGPGVHKVDGTTYNCGSSSS